MVNVVTNRRNTNKEHRQKGEDQMDMKLEFAVREMRDMLIEAVNVLDDVNRGMAALRLFCATRGLMKKPIDPQEVIEDVRNVSDLVDKTLAGFEKRLNEAMRVVDGNIE